MKKIILTGCMAALTLLCVSATDRRPVPAGILRGLLEEKLEPRTRAFQAAKSQRESEIAQLLAIARQKQKVDEAYGARHLAIELLGEYRADEQEVVQFLLDNITLRYNVVVSERSPLTGYACATALSKIGQLATYEISGRLEHDRTDKELELYAHVIRQVDGEVTITRFRLETRLKEADGARKRNLEKMLGFLAKD